MTLAGPDAGSDARAAAPPGHPPNQRSGSPRPRRRWIPVVVALALVACFVLVWALLGRSSASRSSPGAGPRPILVAAATAKTGDLGVYVTGLGTVTPLRTVTVHTRVDGELVSVAYREGQLVHEGELLAQIDPRPFEVQLHQAEGQLAKDTAALEDAKLDLERYKVLLQQDSIPKQQLDAQVATVGQDEAAIQVDQAQIENAKLNLTYSRITAPLTGVVGLRLVDPGNIVHATDPNGLLVITQVQPISVVFTIPADRLQSVLQKTRSGRRLEVEAWDRDLAKKLAVGSLLALDNEIDPTTGTIRIKAAFPNEDLALYPDQFVNARLLVDTLRNAVLIPTAAIERGPQTTYVYVVTPDGKAEMRNVTPQLTEGDLTALSGGVSAGEVVVVEGLDKLQPGAPVTVSKESGGRKQAS